jgi:RHS repeat-associated protein
MDGTDDATCAVNGSCVVLWPAPFQKNLWYLQNSYADTVWHGSLILGKRDASGLLYMRNRYYDPAAGRFTQKDPIGFADGICQ